MYEIKYLQCQFQRGIRLKPNWIAGQTPALQLAKTNSFKSQFSCIETCKFSELNMQTSLSFRTALSCIPVCSVCPGCCFCLSCFVSPVVVRATLRSIYPSLTMSNIWPMMNDFADLMNVFCGFSLPASGLKKGHGNAK